MGTFGVIRANSWRRGFAQAAIDASQQFIEDHLSYRVRMLKFAAVSGMEESDLNMKKHRPSRDPMSHRIIEKRRRDRMNNCLSDLSQLIPATYMKQGQGRIEKTEIIEMAIKHIKQLQAYQMEQHKNPAMRPERSEELFYLGFNECQDETMRYLVEKQGMNMNDQLMSGLISHLKTTKEYVKPPLPVHREPPMVPPPVVNNTYIQLESATQSSDYDSHCSDSGIGNRVESMHCSTSFTVTTSAGSSSGSFASSSPMDTQSGMHMKEQNYPGSQRMSNSDSECSRGSSYKFKNHIKLRFSADEDTEKHSPEAISRDSRKQQTDCKPQIFNRDLPMGSVTVTNISAPLTPPNSASPASSVHAEPKGRPEQEMDNSNKVPGFALHPTGTFYIPVVISMSQIMPYLSFISASALSGICHPISIPVVFSGPTVVSQSSSSSPATPSTPTQMGHSVPLTQGNLQAHHLRTEQSLS